MPEEPKTPKTPKTPKNSVKDFLHPASMLTPGLAGAVTMMITNALANQFEVEPSWTGLIISFICGLLVLVSNVIWWQKAVYYVLNSLIIFCVAAGSSGFASSATESASIHFGISSAYAAQAATKSTPKQLGARLKIEELKRQASIAKRKSETARRKAKAAQRKAEKLRQELKAFLRKPSASTDSSMKINAARLEVKAEKQKTKAAEWEAQAAKSEATAAKHDAEATKLEATITKTYSTGKKKFFKKWY